MRLSALIAAFAAVFLIAAPPAMAQGRGRDLDAQRAAIERLAPMLGNWAGEAQVLSPHAMTVYQTEHIERDLGGLLLIIHGNGYANAEHTGAPVFQALAVVSYDETRQIYEFRSYTNGYATTATGVFQEDGSFRWQIDVGPNMIQRFTIHLTSDRWIEDGEFSRDGGATWTPTIHMSLARVS